MGWELSGCVCGYGLSTQKAFTQWWRRVYLVSFARLPTPSITSEVPKVRLFMKLPANSSKKLIPIWFTRSSEPFEGQELDTYGEMFCPDSQWPCGEVAVREPTDAGNDVTEVGGGYHSSSSPPSPSQALNKIRYPFIAGWTNRVLEKIPCSVINPLCSAPVVSALATQHQWWAL